MKTRNIFILLSGLLVAILVVWQLSTRGNAVDDNIYAVAQKGKFDIVVTTTGELRAKNSIEIKGPGTQMIQMNLYQVPISKIVPEGTVVEEGDFVAALDKNELQGKIQESQLNLDQAQSQYEQTRLDTALTLSKERNEIVNLKFAVEEKEAEIEQSAFEAPATQRKVKLEFEKAQRAYEQALSNYQKQIDLSVAKVKEKETALFKERNNFDDLIELEKNFTIMAPSSGMVIYHREWGGRKRTVGSNVRAWDPIVATLPDLSIMESVTYVNEIDIQKIRDNQEVEIGLDAMPDKNLTGTVTSVANIGEQQPNSDSKVFEVVILINESDTTLRPAMTTSNQIIVKQVPETLYVPLECLHAQDSISYVFKREGLNTIRQEVMPGLMNENDAQILAGLEEKDKLFFSMPDDTTGLKWNRLSEEEVLAETQPEL